MTTTVSTGEPTAIGANDQDLAPGSEVGEYRIEGVLGKGGFGTVYSAVQPVIGKLVAIKLLARRYSADPTMVSRFVAEARAVNQIRHRNIIDIFSFGQLTDGRHYYVMEHLDGDPLDLYLRNHGPLSLDEAIPVLRAIARALDAAHAKGIAHRDLKPENIFLARDTDGGVFPKLLDFGIAKLMTPDDEVRHKTNTGVPMGTPYYMSPEQCRGKDVDHRTDIYSFGIVVYRLLTGTFPFDGDDYMELLFKQINEEPPPASSRNPQLPPSVDEAIGWMMRKDRTQRPPNVIEGINALDPSAAVTPPNLPPARGSRPTVPPPRTISDKKASTAEALAATFTPEFVRPELPAPKRSLLVFGAIAIVLLAGGAAAWFALRSPETPSQAAPVPARHVPTTDFTRTPATPPAATPPAATPPSVPDPIATPAVAPPADEPVRTKRKRRQTSPTAAGSGSALPAKVEPKIVPENKAGDYQPLGSDAFKPAQ